MRINLKVPFAEKEQAKKLGARWDAARKIWYVEQQPDMAPFAQWSPTAHESSAGDDTMPQIKNSAFRQQGSGKVHIGADYVELPKVCDCLPWDSCEKCAHLVLKTSS
ncbi:hypothetical protein KI610_08635 [Ferribacterium limneticum]|nr:hypothetical protein KI610_08635 [Ferribacterium limneticum]